jgi:hypothetical protein
VGGQAPSSFGEQFHVSPHRGEIPLSELDPLALPADNATPEWLALPEEKLPVLSDWLAVPGIETQKNATSWDGLRFQVMKGTHRVWACDGEYLACRPSAFANETISNRHQKFLRAGHYEHLGTFDDVQVFRVLPGSPFFRNAIDLREAGWYECLRGAALAACQRDWTLYHDVLDEVATRLKSTPTGTASGDGGVDPTIARDRWDFVLAQIFAMIQMRGGPTQPEVDAGLAHVRRRRGFDRGRVIALPTASMSRRLQ